MRQIFRDVAGQGGRWHLEENVYYVLDVVDVFVFAFPFD